jgi:acetyl esterase/lipase
MLVGSPVRADPAPAFTEVAQERVEVGGRQWTSRTLEGRLVSEDGSVRAHRAVVWIYTPPVTKTPGVVLGLPGWKFDALTWEEKARVSDHAEALGVTVALAQMHTTVYESAFYPESRSDRRWCGAGCSMPGSPWVGEVLVPWLSASVGPVRGLFGLSTGGRGAVLVPQHYPGLRVPRACAMSGTFDLASLEEGSGEYKIHANVYGPRDAHPGRWRADDSLVLVGQLDQVSVLLIHGSADPHVPAAQSRSLAAAMTQRGGAVTLVEVAGGKHDWALWSSHLRQCLAFLVEAKE